MRIIGVIFVAVLLFFATGARITTADAKHEAKSDHAELIELRKHNDKIETELTELKVKYDDLLRRFNELVDYFERHGITPEASYGSPLSPDIIRVPGTDDNDDSDDDDDDSETHIIERNNTTTVPPVQDNNDNDDDDDSSMIELPDVQDTKDDLLKDTPLDGVL